MLNETGCIISMYQKNGVIALQDTHVVILGVHWTAMYLYYTNNSG